MRTQVDTPSSRGTKALRGLQEPLLGPTPGTIQIPLTRGKFAIIDDLDFNIVSPYLWFAKFDHGNWYARRNSPRPERKSVFMHIEILGRREGVKTDHENGDGLDNRRLNLRFATNSQNSQNKRPVPGTKTGLKGSYPVVGSKTFQANIMVNRKRIFLGTFSTAVDAARAYDSAARKFFGDFALCNFPLEEVHG